MPNKNNIDHGFCKNFANKITIGSKVKIIYNYAKHCRDNEYLCGRRGWLFEDINDDLTISEFNNYLSYDEITKIKHNTLEEINNCYEKDFTNDEKNYFNYYLKYFANHNVKKDIFD